MATLEELEDAIDLLSDEVAALTLELAVTARFMETKHLIIGEELTIEAESSNPVLQVGGDLRIDGTLTIGDMAALLDDLTNRIASRMKDDDDFLPQIKGDRGPRGPQGARGVRGSVGVKGPRGADGDEGERGPRGVQGFPGQVRHFDRWGREIFIR